MIYNKQMLYFIINVAWKIFKSVKLLYFSTLSIDKKWILIFFTIWNVIQKLLIRTLLDFKKIELEYEYYVSGDIVILEHPQGYWLRLA